MAISIDGVLYTVGLSTNGFTKGVEIVKGGHKALQKSYDNYQKQLSKVKADLQKKTEERTKAEEKLNAVLEDATSTEEERTKAQEAYKTSIDALNASQSQLIKRQDELNGKIKNLGVDILPSANKALLAVSAPLTAIAGVGLKAWGTQEEALTAMRTALIASGQDVSVFGEKFEKIASSIQHFTTFGDEAILKNMQLATSFGIPAEKMEDVQKGAVGLATMFDKSLPEATKILARALSGNFEAFNELIPEIRNCKTDAEKLALVNEALVQGWDIAKAKSDTFNGSLVQAKNAVGDAGEEIGKVLAPAVISTAKAVKGLAEWFSGLSETQKVLVVSFGASVAALPAVIKGFTALATAVRTYRIACQTATIATNTLKLALIKSGIGALVVGLGTALGYCVSKFVDFSEETKEAGEASEDSAPKIDKTSESLAIQQEELKKTEEASKKYRNALEKLAELNADRRFKNMSQVEQMTELVRLVDEAKKRIELLNADIAKGGLSMEHLAFSQEEIVKWTQKLYGYEDKIKAIKESQRKEADAEAKKKADEAKRKVDEAKKEAEAQAKKIAERALQMKNAREEFELQLKISKLENGTEKQQRQAEALKNAIKRNELMEKYGYSIEEATKKLIEMHKTEEAKKNKGKMQYSEEDIARAKRVVERGKGGTVGKKTLEQAQKILNGEDIGNTEYSGFIGAKKRAKKVGASKLDVASNEQLEAAKKSSGKSEKKSKKDDSSAKLESTVKDAIQSVKDMINANKDLTKNVQNLANKMKGEDL